MAIPVLSVTHVNVNCSVLERSLTFYRELLGLEASVRTHPEPQDGAAFGLAGDVQWDAGILHDRRGFAGPAVDLLEWKQPRPVGRPTGRLHQLGFTSLGFGVPDVDAAHRRARSLGVRCLAEPAEVAVDTERRISARAVHVCDPDGTLLELVEQPVPHPRLGHVTLSCSDLRRSLEWYERVLGLRAFGRARVDGTPGAPFELPGEVAYEQRYLRVPDRDDFDLDLIQWRRPTPVGRPPGEAHRLGIYRLAFLVEDVQACVEEIRSQGVACPDPALLDMGPTIPVDGLRAVLFPDPDGACLELIESPV